MRVVLSDTAKEDLSDIWLFTAKAWSEHQADTYIERLYKTIQSLEGNPELLRPWPDKKSIWLRLKTGSHFVFATALEGEIRVWRILHVQMDFWQHLPD